MNDENNLDHFDICRRCCETDESLIIPHITVDIMSDEIFLCVDCVGRLNQFINGICLDGEEE